MNNIFGTTALEIYDIIGVVGFFLYVMNYSLLTLQKLRSEQVTYFIVNWFAAGLVLIGLMQSFNLASVLIQVFWLLISSVGIYIRLRRPPHPRFQSIRNRGFRPT